MTEQELKDLGWVLVKEFDHNKWRTNRYAFEQMEIEFTYKKDKLISIDLCFKEHIYIPVNPELVQLLTKLLTKTK